MTLSIITIGKRHEDWIEAGITRYQKRLKAPMNVEWVLLPHSAYDGVRARQDESQRIHSRLSSDEYVVLLDERGKMLDSPGLNTVISHHLDRSRVVTFIIGGAYGVSDELRARADFVWSLSPLVFPHQLVRLILIEQLYRAQEIARGGKYHHE
jgi:23S rRNA (pseudouridine1915-N3)-methyltransferase